MKDQGLVFDIQRWSIHDGYGIRTNVFLKGCPLRCRWCSNPESQKVWPELAFFPDKCIGCRSCEVNCAHHAIRFDEDGREHDISSCREHCYTNGEGSACLRECYSGALKRMGEMMAVEKVMGEVLSDKGIYDTSGGGVTFTGGEPFMQHDFLLSLLKSSKEHALHTTIESCVCVPWEHIEASLPYVDFLFADLKMLNGEKHRLYTGSDNDLVLANLQRLNEYAASHPLGIAVRMPVIPGINDTPQEIDDAAAWIVKHMDQVRIFELLPYHRLGRGKYLNIGEVYSLDAVAPPEDSAMDTLRQIVKRHGLETSYQ